MSSENTVTGEFARAVVEDTLVARGTEWNVNPKLATKSEWGDSDSAGYTNRAAGRKDCTFTMNGKYDKTDEVFDLFQPHDMAKVFLWMHHLITGLYWSFPRALCDDFNIMVNMDSMEVEGWTSAWGADGKFYKPGQSGAPVASSIPATYR